jgi:hypothetical protein
MGGDGRNPIAGIFLIVFISLRDGQVKTGGVVRTEEPVWIEEKSSKPEYRQSGEVILIGGLYLDRRNRMLDLRIRWKWM